MSKELSVLDFINLVKGKSTLDLYEGGSVEEMIDSGLFSNKDEVEWGSSRKIIEEIFTSGACGRFSRILKHVFPEGEILINYTSTHTVFSIDNHMYDITGDVTKKYKDEKFTIADESDLEDLEDNYSFYDRGPII